MQFFRIGPALCLASLLMAVPIRAQPAGAPPSEQVMREYEAKLADYTKARQEFDDQNRKYWGSVAEKRRTLRRVKVRPLWGVAASTSASICGAWIR